MKQSERLEMIIAEIYQNGHVQVSDLSERLGCSEVTIRSDIRLLDQQGVLKKAYGGAIRKEKELSIDFIPGEFYLNSEKKSRIAKRAYEYIANGDSIMIDDSTTGCYLAKCIKKFTEKEITVVTNSILAAAELSMASHVSLFIVGGHVIGNPPSALDNITVNDMKQFHVDKAFIGVNGINLNVGLTSMGTPQMDIKREIINVSHETFVLADSSKFDNRNLFTVCKFDKIDKIITDSEISKATIQLAKLKKVLLDIV
jgi:DeoR/GlpR family transcriptional regulator of sugar metabolism